MEKKSVRTSNGKYYQIKVYSSGKCDVYNTTGSYSKKLGEVSCIADAIAIIKADSGSDIKSMT